MNNYLFSLLPASYAILRGSPDGTTEILEKSYMPIARITHLFVAAVTSTIIGLSPTITFAADYNIDSVGKHGYILFNVSHMGFSTLSGRFNDFGGSFTWDKDDPSGSSVQVTIQTASLDTNHEERDNHLRSADFFNVEKHATAEFVSTAYQGDASGGTLAGDLTLNGITHPIDISITAVGEGKDPWGGYRAGFSGEVELQAVDFEFAGPMFPKTITMSLSLEGIQQ